jgi:putative flavoprotein involved in K+ transport
MLSSAPVRTHTTVTRVQRTDAGYDVATTNGDLRCRTIMIASGACNAPSVPALGTAVPPSIRCFTPFSYRNPNDLPEGGVLSSAHRPPATTRRRNHSFRPAGHSPSAST